MIFAAPLVLLGLAVLPALFLLLRLTPPPPRRIAFPPLALLQNLASPQRQPDRTPLWLLLLRLAAAALVILGLAGPSWHNPALLPGTGPVLLVIDNGWASAADWPQRRAAAANIIAAAGAAGRAVAIFPTAAPAGEALTKTPGVMTSTAAAQFIAALQPEAWPPDRIAATRLLQNAPETTRIYIADGLTDGPDFQPFLKALSPSRVLAAATLPTLLLPPKLAPNGDLQISAVNPPPHASLTARTATGAAIDTEQLTAGHAQIHLPLALARKIAEITLAGPPSAAATQILDGSAHAVLAGLSAGSPDAEAAFLGPLYFIRRALPPGTQTITGTLDRLIAAGADVIVMADTPLSHTQAAAAQNFVASGGILIRFAGPLTASNPDGLAPDPLLAGDRRLGGALTWSAPQPIADFPANALFAGLTPGAATTVSRQILADPTRLDPATIWAILQDGTPLVLGARQGKGYLIAVLTTANADWSNLALSGLFPAMMGRMTSLATGAPPGSAMNFALQDEMSAFGTLEAATTTARLTAADLGKIQVSARRPPGLYVNGDITLPLNLGGHVSLPAAANLPGAAPLAAGPPVLDLGPDLLAAAILLLITDLLVSLGLRGLLARPGVRPGLILLALMLVPVSGQAQTTFLRPTIGYITTSDPATDALTADGLSFLSANVSAHTSAQLGAPAPLDPAADDLAPYPLIYWPILPNTPAPAPAACAALTSYMQHGGLLMIDTTGSDPDAPGSGAGFAPGTTDAIARATACLLLPPLTPLTPADVLAHCFYIVQAFSGRFTGAPVLVASPAARDPDGVTPVIITQNDFAGAWARDANGDPEQTPLGDGDPEIQRSIADRFGTNLVIYALTGTYKSDQGNVSSLLDKIGQ